MIDADKVGLCFEIFRVIAYVRVPERSGKDITSNSGPGSGKGHERILPFLEAERRAGDGSACEEADRVRRRITRRTKNKSDRIGGC